MSEALAVDHLIAQAHRDTHRLHSRRDAHAAVHGQSPAAQVNRWLAVRITNGIGTMWCAYAFALLALVSLPAAIASHSPVIIVQWISQTFLQLVLLSIIIVGQNVQAEATDQRAEADHETLELLRSVNAMQLTILQELRIQAHQEGRHASNA